MKMYQLVIIAWACTWSMGAQGQWQWLDKGGRKVFSDLAPPPNIPQSNILQHPGSQQVKTPPDAASEPLALPATHSSAGPIAAGSAGSQTTPEGTDTELQQRKAQLQVQEAARKKNADAKAAALRADNCSRAQRAKGTYESGRPLHHTNAQGELVWMDESARSAEMRRIQTIIASDCSLRP